MGRLFDLSDFFCLNRKFLIYNLIARNLKIRYRKSFFGMIWTVLIPAGTAGIYFFIFNHIFKVDIQRYPLFILSGLIPWIFFATTISTSIESLVANFALLNKVPLPLPALPLSEALTHFLNLVLSFPVLIAAMWLLDAPFTWAALQYPVLILALLLMTNALGFILALLYVYFRDLKHMVTLILQFWFYLTPIMYSEAMVPERFHFAFYVNPLGCLFLGFHAALLEGQWLEPYQWFTILGWTLGLTAVAMILSEQLNESTVEML